MILFLFRCKNINFFFKQKIDEGIDTSNILQGGRRTRGARVDYSKFQNELDDEEDDEDEDEAKPSDSESD